MSPSFIAAHSAGVCSGTVNFKRAAWGISLDLVGNCFSSDVAAHQEETDALRSLRGDEGRSRGLQAVPVGAERLRQGPDVQGVAVDEDRERGEGQLFRAEIRKDAGTDQIADAGRHRGEPAESRGDGPDTETVQERFVLRVFGVEMGEFSLTQVPGGRSDTCGRRHRSWTA